MDAHEEHEEFEMLLESNEPGAYQIVVLLPFLWLAEQRNE